MVVGEETDTIAIIQARASSSRLPGKVLKHVNGRPILEWQILRALQTKNISRVILATSDQPSDDETAKVGARCGIPIIRGNLENVLSRFVKVINQFNPKTVIRITGDCPLYMPRMCETMLSKFSEIEVDYLSNTLTPTFPDGCDIEIFTSSSLLQIEKMHLNPHELEHVTPGIYRRKELFRCVNFTNIKDESVHRWTLDTQEDLDFISAVYAYFTDREIVFTYNEVMEFLRENPRSARYDSGFMRNSGSSNEK